MTNSFLGLPLPIRMTLVGLICSFLSSASTALTLFSSSFFLSSASSSIDSGKLEITRFFSSLSSCRISLMIASTTPRPSQSLQGASQSLSFFRLSPVLSTGQLRDALSNLYAIIAEWFVHGPINQLIVHGPLHWPNHQMFCLLSIAQLPTLLSNARLFRRIEPKKIQCFLFFSCLTLILSGSEIKSNHWGERGR